MIVQNENWYLNYPTAITNILTLARSSSIYLVVAVVVCLY